MQYGTAKVVGNRKGLHRRCTIFPKARASYDCRRKEVVQNGAANVFFANAAARLHGTMKGRKRANLAHTNVVNKKRNLVLEVSSFTGQWCPVGSVSWVGWVGLLVFVKRGGRRTGLYMKHKQQNSQVVREAITNASVHTHRKSSRNERTAILTFTVAALCGGC